MTDKEFLRFLYGQLSDQGHPADNSYMTRLRSIVDGDNFIHVENLGNGRLSVYRSRDGVTEMKVISPSHLLHIEV